MVSDEGRYRGRVPRVRNPFTVNPFARLQAFCNIVLSTGRGKDLFDVQHLLCHLTEELNIKTAELEVCQGPYRSKSQPEPLVINSFFKSLNAG